MCQEHNGTRICTKADCGNSGYWSEELCSKEQALRGALRGAPRARLEGPRSLPGSRCNTTLDASTILFQCMKNGNIFRSSGVCLQGPVYNIARILSRSSQGGGSIL